MKKNTLILILVGLVILCAGITIGISINIKNSSVNKNDNQINNSMDNTNKVQGTNDDKKTIENSSNESNVVSGASEDYNQAPNVLDESVNQITEPKVEPKVEPKTESTITYSSNDTKVIETLEEAYNNIKNSEVTEKFKVNAKATFINIVDFLFYDGTIKGVTFKELTDTGKAKVLELANKIDEAIEAKVPNYKDNIASGASKAYKACSELIKKGSSNLNSFLQSKLSEENYNSIINSKDDLVYYTKNAVSFLKDTGSKLFSSAKEKLSDWYNKYKNN